MPNPPPPFDTSLPPSPLTLLILLFAAYILYQNLLPHIQWRDQHPSPAGPAPLNLPPTVPNVTNPVAPIPHHILTPPPFPYPQATPEAPEPRSTARRLRNLEVVVEAFQDNQHRLNRLGGHAETLFGRLAELETSRRPGFSGLFQPPRFMDSFPAPLFGSRRWRFESPPRRPSFESLFYRPPMPPPRAESPPRPESPSADSPNGFEDAPSSSEPYAGETSGDSGGNGQGPYEPRNSRRSHAGPRESFGHLPIVDRCDEIDQRWSWELPTSLAAAMQQAGRAAQERRGKGKGKGMGRARERDV